jgi:hypothetical protein
MTWNKQKKIYLQEVFEIPTCIANRLHFFMILWYDYLDKAIGNIKKGSSLQKKKKKKKKCIMEEGGREKWARLECYFYCFMSSRFCPVCACTFFLSFGGTTRTVILGEGGDCLISNLFIFLSPSRCDFWVGIWAGGHVTRSIVSGMSKQKGTWDDDGEINGQSFALFLQGV